MADNYATLQDLAQIKAKLNALMDMVTNKPQLSIDSSEIEDFIEKYGIVKEIVGEDTLTAVLNKINELNSNIETIQKETEAPLIVAQQQSQKIIDMYSKDEVSLALNIADIKMFKNEIYASFKNFIDYIDKLNIQHKMSVLNEQITVVKNMKADMISQSDKIKNLFSQINEEQELVTTIKEVNKQQDAQIDYLNNLIITIEKQIENYAFFANEFNKIYINAKEFMQRFAESLETLTYIEEKDAILYELVKQISSVLETDFSIVNKEIEELSNRVDNFTNEMLSWLNYSLMFTNEVKAYNLSLSAYNKQMDDLTTRAQKVIQNLETITLN